MPQARRNSTHRKEQNAIALLTEDHKKVKVLFRDFAKLTQGKGKANDKKKEALVHQLCAELTIHAQVEEEIFYPAACDAIENDDIMDEAEVEHASAKALIKQLEVMQAGDDLYDAKVTVLGEQIDHHVKEEQDSMFPKARKAGIDLVELGTKIRERKDELQAD